MPTSGFMSGFAIGLLSIIAYAFCKKQKTGKEQENSSGNTTSDAAADTTSSSAAIPVSSPAPVKFDKSKRKQWDKEKLKMILCVRNDLGMGKGKIAAQCCHAAVGVVQELLKSEPELVNSWDYNGAMKIALKVNSEEELLALESEADKHHLGNYLVVDAGHTQIAPDTTTVLAIGPAPAKILDKITGHLKLM